MRAYMRLASRSEKYRAYRRAYRRTYERSEKYRAYGRSEKYLDKRAVRRACRAGVPPDLFDAVVLATRFRRYCKDMKRSGR